MAEITPTQLAAVDWHLGAGGKNVRLAGHALRLLCEAVELCVAAGANPQEIEQRVHSEIAKALERGEFTGTGAPSSTTMPLRQWPRSGSPELGWIDVTKLKDAPL